MGGTRAHAPSITGTKLARARAKKRATDREREREKKKKREREIKRKKKGANTEAGKRPTQLRPEGRNRRGETRLRGSEVLGGGGASEFDPSFQQFGVSETPSQRPLRAPERLSGPRGRLFKGLPRGVSVFKGAGNEGGPFRDP